MRELHQLGFQWVNEPGGRQGAIVRAVVDGVTHAIFVPIRLITLDFSREFGAPPSSVGACPTVAGFFGWLRRKARRAKRAVQRATRSVSRAVKRVARKSVATARSGIRALGRAVPKRFVRAAQRVYRRAARFAKQVARITKKVVRSPILRAGLAALAVAVPVLAPAVVALETANQLLDAAERGYEAARKVAQGARDAYTLATARSGEQAKAVLGQMATNAKRGDPRAQQVMGGVKQLLAA